MNFWGLTLYCALTIFLGILGFFVSIAILVPPNEKNTFFEITFNEATRKSKLQNIIRARIKYLNSTILNYRTQLKSLGLEVGPVTNNSSISSLAVENPEKLDREKIKVEFSKKTGSNSKPENDSVRIVPDILILKLSIAESALARSLQEQINLRYFNLDKLPNFYSNYLSIDRNSMYNFISISELDLRSKKDSLVFNMVDTTLVCIEESHWKVNDAQQILISEPEVKDTLHASIYEPKLKMSFIGKYPVFGLWLVFSIGQMTIWFLIIMVIIGITVSTINSINKIL